MSRFTNPSTFPSFHELPPSTTSSSSSSSQEQKWHLLAQIKENMTITQPTFIVTDRTGTDFALLFDNVDDKFNPKGFRKGYTVAVPRARRTDRVEEGKRSVVRVSAVDGVKVIPGQLDRVLELGVVLDASSSVDQKEKKCAACGKMDGKLMNCTGCDFVAYCGQECQARSWSEMDHKHNCKVLKALQAISV
ncbi:hypothetical protein GGS20DRAFT_36706 [Poronia punctata]|nr:hypothetical protein GGS20DRAFT_36706 [Poronia punctata]